MEVPSGDWLMKSLLALVLCVGCGASSSTNPGDWVPEDIDEQATLDRIGTAGYQKLCGAFEDYVRDMYRSDRLIQAACTANALQTTADAAACGVAVDMCLDMIPPAVETQLNMILAQAKCSALGVEPTGCQSKVAQMKSCLDALGKKVDQIMFSLTCAAFGSPVPETWWKIEPPAECSAISSQC